MLVTCLGFSLLMWFPGALNAPNNAQSCSTPRLNDGFFVPKWRTYPDGSQLTYTCHEGHKPAVKGWWEQITCQDGRWSHEPQCIHETACIPLHIPNAQYSENSQGWYNEGDIINVTCNEGYEPKDGITDAVCSEGKWTDVPVCRKPVLKCTEPPKIPHAIIIDLGYQDEFPPDATVNYRCQRGYSLEGGGTIKTATCSYGTWSDTPTCNGETTSGTDRDTSGRTTTGSSTTGAVGGDTGPFISIDKCGNPPRIANGDVVEKNLKYLKYQCSAFYTLEGSDTVVCHSGGSWSNPPTCLGNYCVVNTDTNAALENTGTQYVKSGDRQEFRCTSSHEISYGYCEDGQITLTRCCNSWDHYWGLCQ